MYTQVWVSGESLANSVVFLWVDIGQPWSKLRTAQPVHNWHVANRGVEIEELERTKITECVLHVEEKWVSITCYWIFFRLEIGE
jgi:hypothetical protein